MAKQEQKKAEDKDKKQENSPAEGAPAEGVQNASTGAGPADGATAETGTVIAPRIARRLTPKEIMGKKIRDVRIPSDLYTLIGRANNLRDGESDFGPWTALRGEFEACRLDESGAPVEVIIGTECFVPGAAGDLLIAAVKPFILKPIEVTPEQKKKGGQTYEVNGDHVEVALIVSVKASTRDGGVGYEFVTRPIISVRKADPLASLRELMAKSMPKFLTAPAPSGAPALK